MPTHPSNRNFQQRDSMRNMRAFDAEQQAKLANDLSEMAEWLEQRAPSKFNGYRERDQALLVRIGKIAVELRAVAVDLRKES